MEEGETLREIDIRSAKLSIGTFLSILKAHNNITQADSIPPAYNPNDLFDGIPINGCNFIFYLTGDDTKRVWNLFGTDTRRDETFKQIAEAFDIG
jgi:hypothetical protein